MRRATFREKCCTTLHRHEAAASTPIKRYETPCSRAAPVSVPVQHSAKSVARRCTAAGVAASTPKKRYETPCFRTAHATGPVQHTAKSFERRCTSAGGRVLAHHRQVRHPRLPPRARKRQ